jgi:hypothetical protein
MKPNSMSKILVLGVFVLFLLSLGACNIKSLGVQIGEEPGPVVVAKSKGGPPPHAPAHGYRAKYSYRYYPSIEMDTDRPYTKFKEHKKKYPPGQLKKKKKKKEKWS